MSLSKENDEDLFGSSCSYTSLIKIDEDTALLAYSDFNYPSQSDPDIGVKTILIRKIHVNYNY